MIDLSAEQIAAAVRNDRIAVQGVLSALAPTIEHHARDAATVNGCTDSTLVSDYAQEANIAVMLSLPGFEGSATGALVKYLTHYIVDAISKARRVEAAKGGTYDISDQSMRTFERALTKANGDSEKAVELAQSPEVFGHRALSPDTAHRASVARMPIASLDETDENGGSVVESLIIDKPKTSMTPQRRETIRRVRETVKGLSAKQADVVRLAVGMGNSYQYGVSLKRTRKGTSYMLDDASGMAAELGTTRSNVSTTWRQAQDAFEKSWTKSYGPFVHASAIQFHGTAGRLSEEEATVVADVEANEEGVRLNFDFRANSVEVIVVNDEGDAVTTWLSIPRAISLGIITGTDA